MKKIILLFLFSIPFIAKSGVENVPIYNPVYDFLLRAETSGFLPNFSLAYLPLSKAEVKSALALIRENEAHLSNAEIKTLEKYEKEFGLKDANRAVLIYSPSDTTQVISKRIISNDEKFVYYLKDCIKEISVSPLAFIDYGNSLKTDDSYTIANIGFAAQGTISDIFGFYIQATNGSLISGNRSFAAEDSKYKQNIKFNQLKDDMDFSESHVRLSINWFNATIGRESRLEGAGFNQRIFMNDIAPPSDAISLGAKFRNFDYKFSHSSLLSLPENEPDWRTGYALYLKPKYLATHRVSFRPSWGEISFWEGIIYSDRHFDLAYINPLSFYKSLEHALRDRDNALMGIDFTLRPFKRVQIKSAFLLDDIRFEEIGKGFWANKSAFNIGVMTALPNGFDIGIEYARVEPYTYTHFNYQNSFTNDSMMLGSYLPPNSEQYTLFTQYWWGSRYPIKINFIYTRHGKNIYDENGELVKNVGSDPLITRRPPDFETGRPADSERVTFLDGDLQELYEIEIIGGFEIFRGFNFRAAYKIQSLNSEVNHIIRAMFSINDFWSFR